MSCNNKDCKCSHKVHDTFLEQAVWGAHSALKLLAIAYSRAGKQQIANAISGVAKGILETYKSEKEE